MENKSLELKVGAAIISALLILILGIIWGKDYRLAARQQHVSFLFENTGGLKSGDPVTVSGVRKGQVSAIRLHKGGALVSVMLDRDVELFSDVRAYITAVELMGGKQVEIRPGSSGSRLDLTTLSEPLAGTQTAGVAELLLVAGELAGQTAHVVERLDSTVVLVNALFDRTRLQQPVHQTAGDLQLASSKLRRLLEENEGLLQRVATNVDYTTQELRSIVERRQQSVDSTLVALAEASKRLNEFSKTLADISHRLQQKQGALGRLIYDDAVIENLDRAIRRVDSAAVDLRKNLARYFSGTSVNLINLLNF